MTHMNVKTFSFQQIMLMDNVFTQRYMWAMTNNYEHAGVFSNQVVLVNNVFTQRYVWAMTHIYEGANVLSHPIIHLSNVFAQRYMSAMTHFTWMCSPSIQWCSWTTCSLNSTCQQWHKLTWRCSPSTQWCSWTTCSLDDTCEERVHSIIYMNRVISIHSVYTKTACWPCNTCEQASTLTDYTVNRNDHKPRRVTSLVYRIRRP